MEALDYRSLGLRVGLEIHQQLNTKHKLFCECPTSMRDESPHYEVQRKLRPTQSELGEIDIAAQFEFKKGKWFIYEGYEDSVCLVELDEEPPHPLNQEALDVALQVALMLNMTPVDEVHVMRKIVIDGSNTCGFQRTARVAMNGWIDDEEGRVRILTLSLEEDAARKIIEDDKSIRYRLDRLGIPLIEIATGPDIHSPEQAKRVALRIGQLLRATRKVKRGIGTIRQDLNISISGGARIEVKGVQELDLIPKVIEYEVQRQLNLLKIRDELIRRGVSDFEENYYDVTDIFMNTQSRVIKRAISSGGTVFASVLPGFAGLVGMQIQPGRRFGTELAERAIVESGVGGIFHTDEMPAYGISKEEVEQLKRKVGAKELDCIVFVAADKDKALSALKAVIARAKEALKGVPNETRAANPDGTTRYMRPMPGAARMYPETDVPPTVISPDRIEKLRATLPELPEQKVARFIKDLGLPEDLAKLMVRSVYLELFEDLIKQVQVSPTLIASTLEYTVKSLKREGVPIENLSDDHFKEVFEAVQKGLMAKEAIPEVLKWLSINPSKSVSDALSALGIRAVSEQELEQIVKTFAKDVEELIKQNPEKAIKVVIGKVMKEYRGRVDGKVVSEIVRKVIQNLTP